MELGLLFLFGLTITSTAGNPFFQKAAAPSDARYLTGHQRHHSAARGERRARGPVAEGAAGLESGAAAVPGGGRAKADGGVLRRRARRCTCYTYKDKECVYYCHLDIIWINTPE
ncbi:hypothetical protein CIB84_004659 [Bambusicola thoracicus]|uniref:Endothelin-3 n=1 Tax=Bambusicola thoracicus TaxID=9083 RepID=A0A2P4T5D7_BAMTH|nr:hypothetical protein CIB84_004659 [Bambusicola thoracicus]